MCVNVWAVNCVCPGTVLSALCFLVYLYIHPTLQMRKRRLGEFPQHSQTHVEAMVPWIGCCWSNYSVLRYFYAIASFGLFIIPTKLWGMLGEALQCNLLFYVDILLIFRKYFSILLIPWYEKQIKKLCLVILFVYQILNYLKLWRKR